MADYYCLLFLFLFVNSTIAIECDKNGVDGIIIIIIITFISIVRIQLYRFQMRFTMLK